MINEERLKNTAAIAQSVAVTLAVVVGGLWTLFTFNSLYQSEKAKMELIGKPALNLSIETTITKPINDSAYVGLVIDVKFENVGTRFLELYCDTPSFSISKLGILRDSTIGSLGTTYLRNVMHYYGSDTVMNTVAIGVQPNSKKTLSYYYDVDKPGIYFINFRSYRVSGLDDSKKLFQNVLDDDDVVHQANDTLPSLIGTSKYLEIK